MQMQSVAVLGAGAIGSYYVYGLTNKPGVSLCVIAKDARRERLIRDGITINDGKEVRTFRPAIKTPEEAHGVDLLLVSTKYMGLKDALPDIAAIADAHTVVVSLLNGIDSEDMIGEVIDPAQVLHAFMRIQSDRRDGVVSFVPEVTGGLFYGETDGNNDTDRIKAIAELMEGTPLHYTICADILTEQWNKFTLNVSYNLPQAVLGVGFSAYYDSEHVDFLRKALQAEVTAVAAQYGITVQQDFYKNRGFHEDSARFSTLQDIEAGRHTEIDMFCGVLMQKAAEVGISVPYATYTYHAIKALEEKNDGLFDYQ